MRSRQSRIRRMRASRWCGEIARFEFGSSSHGPFNRCVDATTMARPGWEVARHGDSALPAVARPHLGTPGVHRDLRDHCRPCGDAPSPFGLPLAVLHQRAGSVRRVDRGRAPPRRSDLAHHGSVPLGQGEMPGLRQMDQSSSLSPMRNVAFHTVTLRSAVARTASKLPSFQAATYGRLWDPSPVRPRER
jgi:hypothetical protein